MSVESTSSPTSSTTSAAITNEAYPLESVAANWVGQLKLDRAQDRVRRAMLREALVRTRGNYTHAASLLGVKRQAVQQMLTRLELTDWARTLKKSA